MESDAAWRSAVDETSGPMGIIDIATFHMSQNYRLHCGELYVQAE